MELPLGINEALNATLGELQDLHEEGFYIPCHAETFTELLFLATY